MKVPATKFKAEQWTVTSDREVWAVIMLDGDEMEEYADQLNESKGVLSSR